ncbi:MAG: 2-dehydropantoate 2-reductase [Paenibacillaceae bacterium]
MRIGIVGGGALGLLFTSQLSATTAQIELITHTPNQSNLLNRQGLQFQDQNGIRSIPIQAYCICSPNDSANSSRPMDWLFLMVKQKDISDSLLKQLVQLSTEETRIVCFQNGIGHFELLMKVFPAHRLYAAITTEGAFKLSDHSIKHAGHGVTWLGRAEESASCMPEWDEPEKMLQSMLKEAGFEVYLSKKITSNIWNKLLINATINPLTAIFQTKNGALLESVYAQDLMKALLEEGTMVARHARIEIADDLWEQLLQVIERTAENHSSMMKDIAEGRTTEIDWINGALLQCANQYKLALPTHQTVYRMVKYVESR